MFLVSHIWKRARKWSLLAAVAFVLFAPVAPALALGESYTWKSTTDVSSFTAKGGSGAYVTDVTFSRSNVNASGDATYSASAAYTCLDNSAHTDTLTITVPAASYNNGQPINPTAATISGGATCAAFSPPTIDYPNTNVVTGAPTGAAASPQCDQGSLSWLFCPVIDNISTHVAELAQDILSPFLEVNTISPSTTPQLYAVWTHVRDFTNVLFIGVFFAIIASTLLQQDIAGLNPYTVKTTWVRLIFAAIMVQISFALSGFIVDIGNVLGAGVYGLFNVVAGGGHAQATLGNLVSNMVVASVAVVATGGIAILVTWEVALPIVLGLAISLFIVFLTLGARFLLIAVLIAVSPLAAIAWVLPNTRDMFSGWFKLLLRLVLMYPLIVGIFAIAGVVNEILPFSSDVAATGAGAVATKIITPLITIAAFLAIPETFKLAGRGLSRANAILNGAGGRGKGFLKSSQVYKDGQTKRRERQASYMQALSTSSAVTSLTSSNSTTKRLAGKGLLSGAALAMATAKSSPATIQKSYKDAQAERTKTLKDFDSISPGLLGDAVLAAYGDSDALTKIKRQAPALTEYTKSLAGRAALVGRANEAGVFGEAHERQILGSGLSAEFGTIQTALGKNNSTEKPHIQRVDTQGLARKDYGEKIAAYTAGSLDKLDKEAIESAMGKKIVNPTTKAVTYEHDDRSRSFAKAWAENTSGDVPRGLYAVGSGSRNRGDYAKRSAFAQMVGTNIDEFRKTENGRRVITELRSALDHRENADIMKDYYKVVLKKPAINPTTHKEYDPLNNNLDYLAMKQSLLNHLDPTKPAGTP